MSRKYDLTKEVSLLSRVDRRLTLSFGLLILILMTTVLITSGLYLKGVMDREEQQLSTLFTQVLATSVSRVSFSGKYHAQLLLEDTQKEYTEIRSLLITDLNGKVLASSIKEKNNTMLEGESVKIAQNVLADETANHTRLTTFGSEPVIEVTLPYSGGFDNAVQGVVQVKLSRLNRDQEIKKGVILITIMVAGLLAASIVVVRKLSLHFGNPVRQLASDMAATLHAIPDLLFELDADGRYLQVLTNREELLSNSRERLLGKTVTEVLPHDAALIVTRALREADKKGESHGHQYSLTLPGGSHWFELSVARKDHEPSDTTHFIVLSRNITERKKTELELEKHRQHLEELVEERTTDMKAARDEAERANAAKSSFLSRMSHELRTPLNAILGFGQMLQMEGKTFTDTQKGNIKEILDAGYHLLDLINEVLDLAKVESGKLEVALTTVQVGQVLNQCLTLIQPQVNKRKLNIINHINGHNYNVQADTTRLKQILLNLLSNAVKYNIDNGNITLDSQLTDNERLRIRVTNTGNGLSANEIEKLFVPFERLNTTKNIEGTGIGLVISKHMIEAMGGSIGVESEVGTSTTFWVELATAQA